MRDKYVFLKEGSRWFEHVETHGSASSKSKLEEAITNMLLEKSDDFIRRLPTTGLSTLVNDYIWRLKQRLSIGNHPSTQRYKPFKS